MKGPCNDVLHIHVYTYIVAVVCGSSSFWSVPFTTAYRNKILDLGHLLPSAGGHAVSERR